MFPDASGMPSGYSELNSCGGPGCIMRRGDHAPQDGEYNPPMHLSCADTCSPPTPSTTRFTHVLYSAPPTTVSIITVCITSVLNLNIHDAMSPILDRPDQTNTKNLAVGQGEPVTQTWNLISGVDSSQDVLSIRSSTGSALVSTFTELS